MFKADMHTHGGASYDGGLLTADLEESLWLGHLDVIAITDHDVIAPETFELAEKYAGHIIVGEEITTFDHGLEVEIIGLFLKKQIPKNKPPVYVAESIIDQGGAIYIPHPDEPRRKGASLELIDWLHNRVGIAAIETRNGRSWSNRPGDRAANWAQANDVAVAAGSDAHGKWGWGRTYMTLPEMPYSENFAEVLKEGILNDRRVSLAGRFHPKLNRLGKKTKIGAKVLEAAYSI